jgi:prevent-host-death family protein
MNWNVAQAKQHLSEMIREAAREPQLIFNRNRPVAAVIAADELAGYRAWKEQQAKPQTLFDAFAELRRLADVDPDPIPDSDRSTMRPNAFVEMLEEEYPSNATR